jgi:hypothetical protein
VKPLEGLPNIFLVLNKKGEKYQLKLEGSTHFVLVSVMSGKTRLSGFAQQNFSSIFSTLVSVDMKNICNV